MKANYDVVTAKEDFITIRDLGPWDKFSTITNAAEEVVAELIECGDLREGMRLYYIDSENVMDEILFKDGKFTGFRHLED